MLTFLRKIRRSLIDSGSARRYLLYAIGEIALVVIGILIALQINNWNEWRKDRIIETERLQNLAENLESNISELEGLIRVSKRGDEASQLILSVLDNKTPYEDSLAWYFGYALNIDDSGNGLSLIGYESLKDAGLDIILNKPLKEEIINLYEATFRKAIGRLDRTGRMYDEIIKLRQERFMRIPGFRFVPFDYNALLKDDYFISWLVTIADNRSWSKASLDKSLIEARRVLVLIHQELMD
jgi:hypothetical protein